MNGQTIEGGILSISYLLPNVFLFVCFHFREVKKKPFRLLHGTCRELILSFTHSAQFAKHVAKVNHHNYINSLLGITPSTPNTQQATPSSQPLNRRTSLLH